MKNYRLSLITLVLLFGCVGKADETAKNEELPIYKRGRVFTFLATQLDESGGLMQQDTILLTTSAEIFNETYGQTKSTWEIASRTDFKENTGITEHDTTVWLHPPRSKVYRKLELSPFPMVQFPLEVGHSWSWPLLVGNHYSVPGHAEWGDEPELFVSHYKITDETILPTKIGELTCHRIESDTESNFDRTELVAYFNVAYGFVRFEYINIDRSQLVMELIAAQDVHVMPELPGINLKNQ